MSELISAKPLIETALPETASAKPKTKTKAPPKTKEAIEEEEEDNEPVANSLEDHIKILTDAGKPPELINLLVSTTAADFKSKWPTSPFTNNQWKAAREIFINSREWVRKDQNVYLNEIRERALLFIVNLTNEQIDASFNEVKDFLKELRDEWIARICDCRDTFILQNYPDDNPGIDLYLDNYDDNTFNQLIRKGGRSSRWDFELQDSDKTKVNHSVKVELKFSSTEKTGVDDLAQFVALNLEGTVANKIFDAKYLDFFAGEGFLQRMVDMCNGMCNLTGENILRMPDTTAWKKAAAATSPPTNSSPEIKKFFETLRRINKDKKTYGTFIEAKKELVNDSFEGFIQSRLGYLNGPGKNELQDLLNTQVDKFFCIFTSNAEGNVECIVDQMPQFEIIEIRPLEKHTFLIITSEEQENNILVGLSWGNGGAGINNPRAMFKLYKKEKRGGSGSDEIGLPDDDPELEEAQEIFDTDNTTATLTNKPPIDKKYIRETVKKRLDELTGQPTGMVLKSGKVLIDTRSNWTTDADGNWIKLTEGGGKKMRNRVYSKKNKKNKFTKKSKINKFKKSKNKRLKKYKKSKRSKK